ncbi:MAG TPA: hypothetical protein VE010_08835 [Thermoanaerobaculia bacterium]|nr:hypothetical protein [Thermoanaerobaculia bacterium]
MLTRDRVAEWLKRRFLLRLHMFFILGGTFLGGLAATHLMLVTGAVDNLALRYGVAVCAAYLMFLALIRLWLYYVGIHDDGAVDLFADGVDVASELASDVDLAADGIGGGGSFGGGGASGSWTSGPSVPRAPRMAVVDVGKSTPKSGFGFDIGFDADEWLVVVLFLALVAALLLGGIYILYTAPMILTEVAFEALLAGVLARQARRIDHPGWVGAVTRATVWPFVSILILSMSLGWAVQKACPDATRLRDAFHCAPR